MFFIAFLAWQATSRRLFVTPASAETTTATLLSFLAYFVTKSATWRMFFASAYAGSTELHHYFHI